MPSTYTINELPSSSKVLECKRNEENKPFDVETAKKYADELYNAGGARKLGKHTFTYPAYLRICCSRV